MVAGAIDGLLYLRQVEDSDQIRAAFQPLISP